MKSFLEPLIRIAIILLALLLIALLFAKVPQSVLYFRWASFLAVLFLLLWSLWRLYQATQRRKQREGDGVRTDKCCLKVPPRVWKKPDPYLYSQSYLMRLGLEVTWDNPDIRIERLGQEILGPLSPNTDYEIVATIHNASVEAPAFNVTAEFQLMDFGAGPIPKPIGSAAVPVVQVQGFPPASVRVPFKSPATGGHKSVIVRLTCTDDAHPENNTGQKNLQVVNIAKGTANVGGLVLPLFNPTPNEMKLLLKASTYRLAARRVDNVESVVNPRRGFQKTGRFLSDVEFRDMVRRSRPKIVEANRQGAFPLPADWALNLPVGPVAVPPGAGIEIHLPLKLPVDLPPGQHDLNVNAYALNGSLFGGITIRINVEN